MGDKNFTGSIGTLPGGQTVSKYLYTIAVTSSVNPSTYGQSVTFTATVGGSGPTPTGTAQFAVDGANLGGPVTLTTDPVRKWTYATSSATSTLSAGNHTVTAAYSGDANYSAGAGTLSGGQTVNKASSMPYVSSSENPSNYGDSVTFTACVSSTGGYPSGNVQFVVDGSNLGNPVPLQTDLIHRSDCTTSSATSALAPGTRTVTANYLGDSNFTSSNGTLSGGQNVMAQTTTTVASSENPSVQGDTVTFTASVVDATGLARSGPTGTVQFAVNGTNYGSPVPLTTNHDTGVGTAAIQDTFTGWGNYTITANYSGDGAFLPSSGTLPGGQTVISTPH
jgi:hypothetical protein